MNEDETTVQAGFSALDSLLEHRARLAVCVLLSRHGEMSFASFKRLLGMTDGNLGAQLRKLEEAGYVSLRRAFEARKPVTWYTLTKPGRSALKAHLDALQSLVSTAEVR